MVLKVIFIYLNATHFNCIVANGGVCCPERWAVRSLHLVGLLNV